MAGNENSGSRRLDMDMGARGIVPVYSNVHAQRALEHLTENISVYDGVKLGQVLEAAYLQGLREGRGERNPGRPRKAVD